MAAARRGRGRGHCDWQHAVYLSGSQYITIDLTTNITASGPTALATTWPSLPDSFKLGVNGAATVGGKLMLFSGGWFVPADGSSPRKKLTDIENWPQTANWVGGLIDAVFYRSSEIQGKTNQIYLYRNSEFIMVNFVSDGSLQDQIVDLGPQPAKNALPASLATSGIDAATLLPVSQYIVYFSGTSVVAEPPNNGASITYYIPALFTKWPATWNPVLNHAPSGRMGNLWCATKDLGLVRHDGEAWSVIPGGGNTASVGQDGTTMVTSATGLYRWNGIGFDPLQSPDGGPLNQVAVGDARHVWVRGPTNAVHSFDPTNNSFAPLNLGDGVPAATHMAANADGTLWHCNNTNPNAFRFITQSAKASTPLQLKGAGIVTRVQKVASTGFGAAHCLAQHNDGSVNVYRYDSPYTFTTAQQYMTGGTVIEQGLGRLYFLNQTNGFVSPDPFENCVVALDAHTGLEVSRSPSTVLGGLPYMSLVFDPVHDLVYVGLASESYNDMGRPGQLLALNARDLTQVIWHFDTPTGIDAMPALQGTSLCLSDRDNNIYLIDTNQALTQIAGGSAVTARWVWQVPTQGLGTRSTTHRVTTPVLANDLVYVAAWDMGTIAPGGNEADGSALYFAQCNLRDGSGGIHEYLGYVGSDQGITLPPNLSAPALGQLRGTDGSEPRVLFINGYHTLYGVNIENKVPLISSTFSLPDGAAQISTGIVYDDGVRLGVPAVAPPDYGKVRIWFGDTNGNLWALGDYLHPTDGTPFLLRKQPIQATPLLYKDSQGGLTVVYGVYDLSPGLHLFGYDPDNGNSAGIDTGVTVPTLFSRTVTNGMLYTSGAQQDVATNIGAQVFGIRLDALPQALRDFVIESQMMQDPDETAPGGNSTDTHPSHSSFARPLSNTSDHRRRPEEPAGA